MGVFCSCFPFLVIIMKIFSLEGPLMTALGKLADLVFCNILFVLFSLPVVTMGASLTALHSCCMSIVNDTEESFIPRKFWKAFRKDFRRSTAVWFVCLGVILLLGAYWMAVGMLGDAMQRMYRITFFVLFFLFLCGFQYVFPLAAQYPMKTGALLKNAWLLSAAALPWTLLSIAVEVGMVYLTLFMRPDSFSVSLFLWAFLLPALITYLNSFFFRMAFRRVERTEIK